MNEHDLSGQLLVNMMMMMDDDDDDDDDDGDDPDSDTPFHPHIMLQPHVEVPGGHMFNDVIFSPR